MAVFDVVGSHLCGQEDFKTAATGGDNIKLVSYKN